MKLFFFRAFLSLVILLMFVLADYFAGLINDTHIVKDMSKQFRAEAEHLQLTTKTMLPNVNHTYPTPYEKSRLLRTNNNGEIIGPELNETSTNKTILFMGGSTTECNEVDEELRFPYLVGQRLSEVSNSKVKTVNIGTRGNTVHDSVNLLNNHISIRSADIIVLMHNINDRLFLSHKPSYETLKTHTPILSIQHVYDAFGGSLESLIDFITYKSNLIYLIRKNWLNYNPWTGETLNIQANREEQIDFKILDNKEVLSAFKTKLNIFISSVRELGKSPVLMTQALGKKSSQQELFNEVIREVSVEKKVLLIDLEKELTLNADSAFLDDYIHLNNFGSKAVAKIISDKLASTIVKQRDDNSVLLNSLDICQDLSNDKNYEWKLSKRRQLLRVSARYPVISDNMEYLLYQTWNGFKEKVEMLNLKNGKITPITDELSSISHRHAVFAKMNKKLIVILAQQDKNVDFERLFIYDIETKEMTPLNISDNISASIPVYSDGLIYFAGTLVDENKKYLEAPNLYSFSLTSNNLKKLTNSMFEEWRPEIKDKTLYYIANKNKNFDIFKMDTYSKKSELFYSSNEDEWDPKLSKDSKFLVFATKKSKHWDLMLASTDNKDNVIEVTKGVEDDWDPIFTPDGRAILFASSSNEKEPYVYFKCLYGEKE